MIENLPRWIDTLFLLAVLYTIYSFYISNGRSKKLLSALLLWSIVHSCLAYGGFYLPTDTAVPRFVFVLLPVILYMTYALLPAQIGWMRQHRDLKKVLFYIR